MAKVLLFFKEIILFFWKHLLFKLGVVMILSVYLSRYLSGLSFAYNPGSLFSWLTFVILFVGIVRVAINKGDELDDWFCAAMLAGMGLFMLTAKFLIIPIFLVGLAILFAVVKLTIK